LENRFRKIETEATFRTKFNGRRQKMGESAEAFSSELKRLYDKAYPKRDKQTRREDLLQRFLEGLLDEKIAHTVEYVKNPNDIDEAAYEVVVLGESKGSRSKVDDRRTKRHGRIPVLPVYSSESDESSEDESPVIRAVGRPRGPKKIREDIGVAEQTLTTPAPERKTQVKVVENTSSSDNASPRLEAIEKLIGKMENQIKKLSTNPQPGPPRDNRQVNGRGRGQVNGWGPPQTVPRFSKACFTCGKEGHFARDCWSFQGQLQVSTHTGHSQHDRSSGNSNGYQNGGNKMRPQTHPNGDGSHRLAGAGSTQYQG